MRESLHRFGLARDRLRAALAHATGIALTDLDAIEQLEADGPLTPTELAERLQLSSGGVTVLADRLERAGWVTRRPHPTDRRSLLLELDPSGLRELERAVRAYHAALNRVSRAIPRSHRAAVIGALEGAADAADAAAAELRDRQAGRRQAS